LNGAALGGRIPALRSIEEETPLRPEESKLKQGQLPVSRVPGAGEDLPMQRRNRGAVKRSEPSRVLVADGDSAMRTGIRLALERAGLEVCDEVEGTVGLMEAVARCEPDVCLVNIGAAGRGMSAVAELCIRDGAPAVIILTDVLDEEEFLVAMRVGAVGYLPTSISASRLPAVVKAVHMGELAIPRAQVAMLIQRLRDRGARRHLLVPQRRGVDLTGREWEVLDLMRDGHSTHEIAARLLISDVTVRRHIGAVLKKLQVESRAEALELLQSA
jgi:DNA-binding NarL/FixJ family response regulator